MNVIYKSAADKRELSEDTMRGVVLSVSFLYIVKDSMDSEVVKIFRLQ